MGEQSEGGEGGFSFFRDITGAFGDILGSDTSSKIKGNSNSVIKGTNTTQSKETTSKSGFTDSFEQLQLEAEAVYKIIQDTLEGTGGLADIFAGERSSGLYNSSAALNASGDLVARIIGEIAKITGKKVTKGKTGEEGSKELDVIEEINQTTSTTSTQTQDNKDGGLIGSIGNLVGL